ncbi:MAG: hypothetical protein ACC656_14400, partial [Candidatus Heimdallarchaeota archaeon]
RSIFYFVNFLTILFSLVLAIYLTLVITTDIEMAVNTSANARSINYDLTVLNFVTIVLVSYYFIIFIFSALINHSQDKNNWIKFINILIVIQTAMVTIYSLTQIWIITRFNSFMQEVENDLKIPMEDLWQGMIRFYISIVISIGFLRLSK